MKIGEKLHDDDGTKFVIQSIYDPNPTLKAARSLRDAGAGQAGENRLVGRIPAWLYEMWRKEAGLRPEDVKEMQDVMRRKLLSGEFDAFRVWHGTY